jgi:hypothetical protein
MWRTVLAVAAGYVATGVLVVITDSISAALIPGFRTLTEPPMKYLVVTLVTDFIYSIVGGYICAAIAAAQAHGATIGLMIFGELMGIASAIFSWNMQPHWFAIALLILYPPGVWIGYKLRPRRVAEAV